MIPRRGAQRAIEVTHARRFSGRRHKACDRCRPAARAQSTLRQQAKSRCRQACGRAGKINLQCRRDIQYGTGIGSPDIAVKKFIGEVFDRDRIARPQSGDDRLHRRSTTPLNSDGIAATNATSDVYAMGGTPIMALAILGIPLDKLPTEMAAKILAGGSAVCATAGQVRIVEAFDRSTLYGTEHAAGRFARCSSDCQIFATTRQNFSASQSRRTKIKIENAMCGTSPQHQGDTECDKNERRSMAMGNRLATPSSFRSRTMVDGGRVASR
jgi:hypothetical protein